MFRRLVSGSLWNRTSTALSPTTLAVTRGHFSVSRVALFSTRNNVMSTPGPLQQSMEEKIRKLLNPTSLEVKNESHLHRHHAPMQGVTSTETHFRMTIVSTSFEGQTLMQRHRTIYKLLDDELAMQDGVHALALVTKTPQEYAKMSSSS
ncbi:bola protein [Syncephalis plumigaleata]|nr:bola protein [Syncephalis plumigaleata]